MGSCSTLPVRMGGRGLLLCLVPPAAESVWWVLHGLTPEVCCALGEKQDIMTLTMKNVLFQNR